jgi:hypothetical protein
MNDQTGCPFCAEPGPRWDVNCDGCCVRKVREMPDRARRRQVLITVRMRRGRNAEDRVRKLVEDAWKQA